MVAAIDPAFGSLPTSRHEAACASGSVATLAAMAELEAERYDVALVVGVELMRNVDAQTAAEHLGSAAWAGREATDARFPWPALFSEIADAYGERWGLEYEHLGRIAELNFANASRNPKAQAREWEFERRAFTQDDGVNPVIEGRLRKQDCGRITDGAAAVVLASPRYAAAHAGRTGRSLDDLPVIRGWGHRTAPMLLADKLARSADSPYLFAHLREAITDAYRRAGIAGPGRPRPDRDPRLLHDHRVHGAGPLRAHRAGRVLAGGRGGRDRAGRQAAGQPERRPDRPRPPGRRDRRADAARHRRAR